MEWVGGFIFSSPEHFVLKVSYCDRPLSIIHAYGCPVSTFALNNFFSKTAGQILE